MAGNKNSAQKHTIPLEQIQLDDSDIRKVKAKSAHHRKALTAIRYVSIFLLLSGAIGILLATYHADLAYGYQVAIIRERIRNGLSIVFNHIIPRILNNLHCFNNCLPSNVLEEALADFHGSFIELSNRVHHSMLYTFSASQLVAYLSKVENIAGKVGVTKGRLISNAVAALPNAPTLSYNLSTNADYLKETIIELVLRIRNNINTIRILNK